MAFPLDKSKYEEVGKSKGLKFLDEIAPATVYDKCNWQCATCGRTYHKTYRAVYLGEHGCRCQNTMSIPTERYLKVGTENGLILVRKANNYKEDSTWVVERTGLVVNISYYALVNARYKHRDLLRQAGIDIPERDTRRAVVNRKAVGTRSMKVIEKREEEQRKEIAKFRLLNQDEEKGIQEVYDN